MSLYIRDIRDTTCAEITYESGVGQMKSVNYPNNYPTGLDCSWTIKVSEGKKIHLVVEDFSTYNSSDRLVIHDGASDAGELMERLYYSYSGLNLISKSNYIYFNFSTASGVTEKGFTMHYEEY